MVVEGPKPRLQNSYVIQDHGKECFYEQNEERVSLKKSKDTFEPKFNAQRNATYSPLRKRIMDNHSTLFNSDAYSKFDMSHKKDEASANKETELAKHRNHNYSNIMDKEFGEKKRSRTNNAIPPTMDFLQIDSVLHRNDYKIEQKGRRSSQMDQRSSLDVPINNVPLQEQKISKRNQEVIKYSYLRNVKKSQLISAYKKK